MADVHLAIVFKWSSNLNSKMMVQEDNGSISSTFCCHFREVFLTFSSYHICILSMLYQTIMRLHY